MYVFDPIACCNIADTPNSCLMMIPSHAEIDLKNESLTLNHE